MQPIWFLALILNKFYITNFEPVHITWQMLLLCYVNAELQILFIWLNLYCFLQKVNATFIILTV